MIERLLEEENPDNLHDFLADEYGLDDNRIEAADKAARMLPEGYGRLGETATRRILDELRKEVINYDEAVRRAGWHHSDDRTGEILPQLPYYGQLLTREIPPGTQIPSDPPEKRWGKITNPTVHIALRQLEKLVNTVIAAHGRPDQIVVELARELKLNEKEKEAHNKRIRETTRAAEQRSAKLQSEGLPDTGGEAWTESSTLLATASLPEKGDVHVLTFTDRQYNIVRFSSQRRKRSRKNPDIFGAADRNRRIGSRRPCGRASFRGQQGIHQACVPRPPQSPRRAPWRRSRSCRRHCPSACAGPFGWT